MAPLNATKSLNAIFLCGLKTVLPWNSLEENAELKKLLDIPSEWR